MHAYNVLKRSLGRPSRGKGAVRMGCVMCMLGELQLGQEPIHAPQRPREHHEPRRGSACRAAPRLVSDSARAANAHPHARAALPSSLRGERIASPCHSSPEQHGERGMANDEQMGRGVAGECGRAHQIRHCHQRGQRSQFGRRRIPQLDAVRRPRAALLTRPTCGTHPARCLSTPAAGPGKSERH